MRSGPWTFAILVIACGLIAASAHSQQLQSPDVLLGRALNLEDVEGRPSEAIAVYQQVLAAAGATRAQKARAQFQIGACYEKLGRVEAQRAYESVVRDFADQSDFVLQARARIQSLNPQGPSSAATQGSAGKRSERVLWTDETFMSYGFSPTAEKVALVDEVKGHPDLVIRDISTGNVRVVVKNASPPSPASGYPMELTWSRDGKQLAYAWCADRGSNVDDGPCDIRVYDFSTGTTRVVAGTTNPRWFDIFDWSSDSRRLLVGEPSRTAMDPKNPRAISWLSVSDGSVARLTQAAWRSARTSPDGTLIACSNYVEPGRIVVSTLPSAGGALTTVVDSLGSQTVVGWASDRRLVVRGDVAPSQGLWTVALRNGRADGPPTFVRPLDRVDALAMTSAGGLLLATHMVRSQLLTIRRSSPADTWSAPQPADFVTAKLLNMQTLSWSPDGKTLLYQAFDGNQGLIGASSEGGKTVQIPSALSSGIWGGPTWIPGNRRAILPGMSGEGASFYRVDLDTADVTRLIAPIKSARPQTEGISLIAMTSDERAYFKQVTHRESEKYVAVVRVDVRSGAETEIFRRRDSGMFVGALSADERWLPAQVNFQATPAGQRRPRPELLLIPTGGGQARVLCDSPEISTKFAWAADQRTVYFLQATGILGSRRTEMWGCSVDGGAAKSTGISVSEISAFAAHPDGRRLTLFGGSSSNVEVSLIENFLPERR